MTVRALAGAALAAASLLLSSCMLLPGKFGSELTLRSDGSFAFSYKGDIHLIALSKLAADTARQEQGAGKVPYEPQPCYDEETIEERKCSAKELAQQKTDWEAGQVTGSGSGADKSARDAEMMKTMMGGIDPSDPKASEEFASRLRRQAGWRSVIDKGDGRFEVDYAIAGRLDHDFSFPTIERMPVVSPFVTAIRRADGSVRIEAPAFAAGNNSPSPIMGMMGAMANSGAKSGSDESLPGMPVLDGTFAVITDGEVLANNTDEGPQPTTTGTGTGKRLNWQINPRTAAAPTALVKLR